MALEAKRYRPLDAGEGGLPVCGLCFAEATGPTGPQFVAVDLPSHEHAVSPDLMHRVSDEGSRVVIEHRDPLGRGVPDPKAYDNEAPGFPLGTTILDRPMVCSECLADLGRLVGLEDVTPYQAQIDERDQEIERLRAEVAEVTRQRDDADETLRSGATFERLLSKPPKTREKTAA